MTDAQIRYHQLAEAKRHNLEQEANWNASLQETIRSDVARENLSRYATDVQKWATEVQANTSRYNAETAAAASRYAADLNARTQTQNALISAMTSRYATDTSAATQKYVTDQNVTATNYRTDVESADRNARLALDRQNSLVENAIAQRRVTLEELRTSADTALTRAQTAKTLRDTANSIKQLANEARRLDLIEEAQQYERFYAYCHSAESITKSMENVASAADKATKVLDYIGRVIANLSSG